MICRKGAYKSPACKAFSELATEWTTVRCKLKTCHRFRPCPLSDKCSHSEYKSDQAKVADVASAVASDDRDTSRHH